MKSSLIIFLILFVNVYSQDIIKTIKVAKLEKDTTQILRSKFDNKIGIIYSSEIKIPELDYNYTFLVNHFPDNKNEFKLVYDKKVTDFDNISTLKNGKKILVKNFNSNDYEILIIIEFVNLDSIKYKYKFSLDEPLFKNVKIKGSIKFETTFINKNFIETTYLNNIEQIYYDKLQNSGFNFSIGAKFLFNNIHGPEIRFAEALYDRPFQGLEFIFNYNYYFTKAFFIYVSLIGHWGTEGAHGGFSFQQGGSGWMYGLGLGYNFFKKFNLVLSGYKIDVDAYSSSSMGYIGIPKNIYKKWNYLFNIGIEFIL
ncbi:MAG: hypothetical protein AB1695_08555 [Stygiobacter sp.]